MRWKHPQRGDGLARRSSSRSPRNADLIDVAGRVGAAGGLPAARATGTRRPDRCAWRSTSRRASSAARASSTSSPGACASNGIDAARLELELTEGVLIEDREQAVAILERLKAHGRADRGRRLRHRLLEPELPVGPAGRLPEDRPLVRHRRRTKGGRDAAIAQAIISLAHALGLRVLAEGVETAEQRRFPARPRLRRGPGLPVRQAVRCGAMRHA